MVLGSVVVMGKDVRISGHLYKSYGDDGPEGNISG